ncbi:TRAP transporter small permease [Brevibacterium album]|uniref:TRAP transporter small permease n=1 Tax=Brevibacterium album TaxID=417948 RepID=UPI0003FADD3B|nr:TRAP transporter small permease [Brevibacterium album]
MKRLQLIATAVSAALLPALVIVVLVNVVSRASGQALSWPFEVSIFLFGISALLAGGQVLRDREHVAVDIIPRRSGILTRTALRGIALLVIAAVAVTLVVQGSLTAYESTRIRERSIFQTTFDPEIWWFRWMIPLGGLLLLAESLRQLFRLPRTVAEDIAAESEEPSDRGTAAATAPTDAPASGPSPRTGGEPR